MAKKRTHNPGDLSDLNLDDPADRRTYAAHLLVEAEKDPDERAAYLCEAAETLQLDGMTDEAEQLFREACDDPFNTSANAHARIAELLFERGQTDEALAVIAEARRREYPDPQGFVSVGELLEEMGYIDDAEKWFTRGLVTAAGSLAAVDSDALADFSTFLLANGRYRVRRTRGAPLDFLDELLDRCRPITQERLKEWFAL